MKIIFRATSKNLLAFILFISACLVFTTSAFSQFSLSAEIRPRTEYRHGFKKLYSAADKPALFTEQRSRLQVHYQAEKYKIGLVLQDVRIWGETAQINKTDGLTSVHEAWAEVFLGKRLSVKTGRQELVYDDHRILGNLDWAAQARSHDAVVLKFSDSTFSAHAGFAFNQDSSVPEPLKLTGNFYATPGGFTVLGGGLPNYKTMQYLWFQKLLGKNQVTGLLLNTGWQMPDTTVNYLLTAGINPSIYLSNTLKFIGSAYYQTGSDRADKTVAAWLLSAAIQYNGFKETPITIGIDVVTGTKPGKENSNTFDPLFGTHHAFYGHMDYFYVGNPHAQQGQTIGLVDIFAKTSFKTSKHTSLLLHAHEFLSQVTILDPENTASSLPATLGSEVDMILNVEYDKTLNFKLGYSQLFATASMEAIKGGDRSKIQNWGWAMLTIKPTLFSTPKTNQ